MHSLCQSTRTAECFGISSTLVHTVWKMGLDKHLSRQKCGYWCSTNNITKAFEKKLIAAYCFIPPPKLCWESVQPALCKVRGSFLSMKVPLHGYDLHWRSPEVWMWFDTCFFKVSLLLVVLLGLGLGLRQEVKGYVWYHLWKHIYKNTWIYQMSQTSSLTVFDVRNSLIYKLKHIF